MHAPTLKSVVTTYPVPVMGMHPFLPKTRLVPNVRSSSESARVRLRDTALPRSNEARMLQELASVGCPQAKQLPFYAAPSPPMETTGRRPPLRGRPLRYPSGQRLHFLSEANRPSEESGRSEKSEDRALASDGKSKSVDTINMQ